MNNPANNTKAGGANSAQNSPLKTNIDQLLSLDLQHSTRLESVLREERLTLQQRDQKQLSALVEEKEQLLGKLDQSAKLRSQWLQQLGLKASADDWEKLVLKQQDPSLTDRYQALNDSVKNCRELNEVNGRLIGRSQQTLAKLLNIMRGTQATPQLYGSNGSTQNSSESRCFTQA
jgi:flagella synthesis protein FlgN